MRALAVQQRTVWHPNTPARMSEFISSTDSRVPAGLPVQTDVVRIIRGRDHQPVPSERVPTINDSTLIVSSAWGIHDPNCQAEVHGVLRFIYSTNVTVVWYQLGDSIPISDKWAKCYRYAKSKEVQGTGITPFLALNGTFDNLCKWFIADDRITLTP